MLNYPHSSTLPPWTIKYEPLPELAKEPLPSSIQTLPQLELKPLPDTLKYVFLGPEDTLPAIIATGLVPNQESQLVDLLKQYKGAI